MIVPIRTVFGTMAVLVGSIVAVAELRHFTGIFIGTWYIFASIFADFFCQRWMINGLELV